MPSKSRNWSSCARWATVALICPRAIFASQAPERQQPVLTVLVHDYAGLTESSAREFQSVSALLLAGSGIQAEWARCHGAPKYAQSRLCDEQLQHGRILIRILPQYPGERKRPVDPLGAAEMDGRFLNLFTMEIRRTAASNDLSFGSLMAYTAVHEIGHLFLGSGHGPTGLMTARWNKAEYGEMRQRRLVFTAAERAAMQRAMGAAENPREIALGSPAQATPAREYSSPRKSPSRPSARR